MKRIVLNYLGIAVIAAFIGIGLSACSNANAQGRNSNASERWEYKVYNGSSFTLESEFNELGKDGWEYVGNASYAASTHFLIFKRRLP